MHADLRSKSATHVPRSFVAVGVQSYRPWQQPRRAVRPCTGWHLRVARMPPLIALQELPQGAPLEEVQIAQLETGKRCAQRQTLHRHLPQHL